MSNKKKLNRPQPTIKPVPEVATNVFDRAENFLERNKMKFLLIFPLIIGTLFAFLLFDVKISEGGDDSMYIEAAWKYSKNFTGYFFTSNAPLYPMLLGVVTMFSGLNLILFKIINCILFLLFIYLTYKAFLGNVPNIVLFPVMLFIACNSSVIFYSSQTYTEMLFFALQSAFILSFFTFYNYFFKSSRETERSIKNILNFSGISLPQYIRYSLYCGFLLMVLTLCKNIAIGMLISLMIFLIIEKRFREMIFVVGGYLFSRLIWEITKWAIWGTASQYGSQGTLLFQKNAYDPSLGNEDLIGFLIRIYANNNLYTSRRLYQILGFVSPESLEMPAILWMLVWALVAFSGWVIWKDFRKLKDAAQKVDSDEKKSLKTYAPKMLFLLIYVVLQVLFTYIILQTSWDQTRVILIYVPFLLVVIFYGIYSFFKTDKVRGWKIYFAFIVLILASSFISTSRKAIAHFPVLKKNIDGDKYYGYTPDWENFLRISEWCADNLPPGAVIASRKAPMSFVYGKGREFFPVYTTGPIDPETNMCYPDSALKYFNDNKITHVILASIRQNPFKETPFIINTLQRMLEPVARKYPGKIKFVTRIGEKEEAYLYEITK